jgi:hypothetical protein
VIFHFLFCYCEKEKKEKKWQVIGYNNEKEESSIIVKYYKAKFLIITILDFYSSLSWIRNQTWCEKYVFGVFFFLLFFLLHICRALYIINGGCLLLISLNVFCFDVFVIESIQILEGINLFFDYKAKKKKWKTMCTWKVVCHSNWYCFCVFVTFFEGGIFFSFRCRILVPSLIHFRLIK